MHTEGDESLGSLMYEKKKEKCLYAVLGYVISFILVGCSVKKKTRKGTNCWNSNLICTTVLLLMLFVQVGSNGLLSSGKGEMLEGV